MTAAAEAKGRGDALYRQGRHSEAAAAYSEALAAAEAARDPSLLHLIYANRAAARLELQDWQGAAEDALQAAAVDDTYLKAHYRAAVALDRLGRPADALRCARRAAALDPSNRQAAELARRLAAADGQAAAGQQHSGGTAAQRNAAAAAGTNAPTGARTCQQPGEGQGAKVAAALWTAWAAAPLTEASVVGALPAALRPGACFVTSHDGLEANVLVMFHGLGDRPAPFAALARHMALPQTAALAPAGPIPIPETNGGRAWLTSFEADFEPILPLPGERRRATSLDQTVDTLLPLLEALGGGGDGGGDGEGLEPAAAAPRRRRLRRRVHLFGFSQGGTVAMEVARRLCGGERLSQTASGGSGSGGGSGSDSPPSWLGSVVCISGALLEECLPALEAAQRAKHGSGSAAGKQTARGKKALPVLLTHGERDDVLPREAVQRSAALLCAAGCDVSLHSVAGKGHAMLGPDRGEAAAVMKFYAKALAAAPPSGGEDGEVIEIT